MRSTESRSASTSTKMSLPPARSLPEAILVSAALMRWAIKVADRPLATMRLGSRETTISSSASPHDSAFSVPDILANCNRKDSARRESMLISMSELCRQLRAIIIVEATGCVTMRSDSTVPLGNVPCIVPNWSRTSDHTFCVSSGLTRSSSSMEMTDIPDLEVEYIFLISGISLRLASSGSLTKDSILAADAPGKKVFTKA